MIATVIALLLSAATNSSYPGFEPLTATDDGESACTIDGRICINSAEPGVLTITRDDREIARWSPDSDGGDLSFKPMPALIRLADGRLLVGALATRQTMYSGGGGDATDQMLALVDPGKAITSVLTVPQSGNLMIRACFGEKDVKHRAGACHDEYRFAGLLSAGKPNGEQLPPLHFRMEASHYPRGVSRDADSLTLPPLRKVDLRWEGDARCTFDRNFHFDVASGKYLPDTALPDCSDYTQP
jgi:hypothetical protein